MTLTRSITTNGFGGYEKNDGEFCPDPESSTHIQARESGAFGSVDIVCCDPVEKSYAISDWPSRSLRTTLEQIELCRAKAREKENWFKRLEVSSCANSEKSAEIEYVNLGEKKRVICCNDEARHVIVNESRLEPSTPIENQLCKEAIPIFSRLQREASYYTDGRFTERLPFEVNRGNAVPGMSPYLHTVNRLEMSKTRFSLGLASHDETNDYFSLLVYGYGKSQYHPQVLLTGDINRQASFAENSIQGVHFDGLRVFIKGNEQEAIVSSARVCSTDILFAEDTLISVRYAGPETTHQLQGIERTFDPLFNSLPRYRIYKEAPKFLICDKNDGEVLVSDQRDGEVWISHDEFELLDPLFFSALGLVSGEYHDLNGNPFPEVYPSSLAHLLWRWSRDLTGGYNNSHNVFPSNRLSRADFFYDNRYIHSSTAHTPEKNKAAVDSIDKKLKNFFENNGISFLKFARLVSEDGKSLGITARDSIDGSGVMGYLQAAFDQLIKKHSDGEISLKAASLAILDRSLVLEDNKLVYRNGNETVELPPLEVANLLIGRVNVLGGKITVGSFSFYDFNQDGKIRFGDDLIEKRTFPDNNFRSAKSKNIIFSGTRFSNMELFTIFPDELLRGHDPQKMDEAFRRGLSFEEMRALADRASSELFVFRHTPDPLADDGRYKILILRYRQNERLKATQAGSPILDNFVRYNHFDEVYAFPENKSYLLEEALDLIASGHTPIDELYIGTHDDAAGMNITLDTDHQFTFNPGARVVMTACNMNSQHAAYLGALFFSDGEGSLLWGSGLNVPLPWGGIYSWMGSEATSYFKKGELVKTVQHWPSSQPPLDGGGFF